MAKPISRSYTAAVPVEGSDPGWVKISFSCAIENVDRETAENIFECIVGTGLTDGVKDFADILARYARDDPSVEPVPMHSSRIMTETHNGSSFTITVEYELPFKASADMLGSAFDACENGLTHHARAHLSDPLCVALKKNILGEDAKPVVHLISQLQRVTRADLIRQAMPNCRIAHQLTDELAVGPSMELDELIRVARVDGEGIHLSVGVLGMEIVPDDSNTGQYL